MNKEQINRMAAMTALRKLFGQNYFDICTIDHIKKMLGAHGDAQTYLQLKALHCIDYSEMPTELREILPRLTASAIGVGESDMRDGIALCEPAGGGKLLKLIGAAK